MEGLTGAVLVDWLALLMQRLILLKSCLIAWGLIAVNIDGKNNRRDRESGCCSDGGLLFSGFW